MDTPSSGAGSYLAAQALRGRGLDDSDSESETATPQLPGAPQTMISKPHSVSSSGSESDDEDAMVTPKQKAQVPGSPASGSESGSEVKGHVIENRVVIASVSASKSGSESESEAEEEEEEQAGERTQEAEKQVL